MRFATFLNVQKTSEPLNADVKFIRNHSYYVDVI